MDGQGFSPNPQLVDALLAQDPEATRILELKKKLAASLGPAVPGQSFTPPASPLASALSHPQKPIQYAEPSPEERSFLAPIVTPRGGYTTEPGTMGRFFEGLGVPGIIKAPYDAAKTLLSPAGQYRPGDNDVEGVDLANQAAGAAVAGGLAKSAITGIERNSLGVFGGRVAAENLAKAGRPIARQAIDLAESMAAKGATRDEIWQATSKLLVDGGEPDLIGVFKGGDGKWRVEISDEDAAKRWFGNGPLSRVMSHDEMYAAYPDVADIKTRKLPPPNDFTARTAAYYDPGRGWGFNYYNQNKPPIEFPKPESIGYRNNDKALSSLLHESQHAIQQREGFSKGRNGAFDADYHAAPGEMEARAVQQRQTMTPEERRANPPWTLFADNERAGAPLAAANELARQNDHLGFYSHALEAAKAHNN